MERHQHREAFHLMQYCSADGSIREWVWNSRDGVTPFVIGSRDQQTELTHVSWGLDIYSPGHRPQTGDRVFVDLTMERATRAADEAFGRTNEDAQKRMVQEFGSREKAVASVAADMVKDGHRPAVSVVGPEGWNEPPAGPPARPDYLDYLLDGAIQAASHRGST